MKNEKRETFTPLYSWGITVSSWRDCQIVSFRKLQQFPLQKGVGGQGFGQFKHLTLWLKHADTIRGPEVSRLSVWQLACGNLTDKCLAIKSGGKGLKMVPAFYLI